MINNQFKQKNASPLFCPRCDMPKVEKDKRWCSNCKGRLFFQGDDCRYAVERKDGYYIWLKNIMGIEGWHYMDFQG
jgi:predicted amidophosphoribosyltransferase